MARQGHRTGHGPCLGEKRQFILFLYRGSPAESGGGANFSFIPLSEIRLGQDLGLGPHGLLTLVLLLNATALSLCISPRGQVCELGWVGGGGVCAGGGAVLQAAVADELSIVFLAQL